MDNRINSTGNGNGDNALNTNCFVGDGSRNIYSQDDSDDVFYGNGFVASKVMTHPAFGDSVSGMISDEE